MLPRVVFERLIYGQFVRAILLFMLFLSQPTRAYEFYAFGDSLTDDGRVVRLSGITPNVKSTIFTNGRSSNGPVWAEYLPGLIGAHLTLYNDYAINGALSGHGGYLNITRPEWRSMPGVMDQVTEFIGTGTHLRPNDLVAIWTGTNDQDLPRASLNGIEVFLGVPRPTTTSTVTSYTLANLSSEIHSLVAAGGRQFLIFNLNDDNGFRAGYADYNRRLPGNLLQFNRSGVNIHFFDLAGLLNQMRRDPSIYGLNPNTEITCRTVPSCNNGPRTLQNTYLTADGTHVMTSVHSYIAQYVANQLLAPSQVATIPSTILNVGEANATIIVQRLESTRFGSTPVEPVGSISPFFSVAYASSHSRQASGEDAYTAKLGYYIAGLDFRPARDFRFGITAGYVAGSADLGQQIALGRVNSYRIAVYGEYQHAGLFADCYLGIGLSDIHQMRRSIVRSPISGSADARDVGVVSHFGYFWPLTGSLVFGPTSGFSYFQAWISSYSEQGDPILTQNVGEQQEQQFTGEIGLEVRAQPAIAEGIPIRSFARLTVRREFLGVGRYVSTSQTYAPELSVESLVSRPIANYGHLSVGASVKFRDALSVDLAADADFLRRSGSNLVIGGRLRYSF